MDSPYKVMSWPEKEAEVEDQQEIGLTTEINGNEVIMSSASTRQT